MTPRSIATAIVVAVLLATPTASAQGEVADDPAAIEARRVFTEGRAHEAAQRYALAAERYQQAYEVMRGAALERAAVALFWAGRALYHVPGRERDARETFQSFLDSSTLLTEDEQVRDWRSEALERIAELDARIGGDPESGGAQALSSPEPEPEPDPVEMETARSISPVGPIVLGVGGAALLTGVVIGAVSLSMDADFRGACDDLTMCPTVLRPQYDEMRAFSTAADVLMVAGGAIAVLGLVLTFTVTEDEEDATVSAVCRGHGCLASIQGSF